MYKLLIGVGFIEMDDKRIRAQAIVAMLNLCDSHSFKIYEIANACGVSTRQAQIWVDISRELIKLQGDKDPFDPKNWG